VSRTFKSLIRLRRQSVDEERRILADLERERDHLLMVSARHEADAIAEQARAREDDLLMASFGSFAAWVVTRRGELAALVRGKEAEIEAQREIVAVAFQELKKIEIAAEQAALRAAEEAKLKEQGALDELALQGHRRKSEAR